MTVLGIIVFILFSESYNEVLNLVELGFVTGKIRFSVIRSGCTKKSRVFMCRIGILFVDKITY